jgi:hypothetical protein
VLVRKACFIEVHPRLERAVQDAVGDRGSKLFAQGWIFGGHDHAAYKTSANALLMLKTNAI